MKTKWIVAAGLGLTALVLMAQTIPTAATRLTGPGRGLTDQRPGEIFSDDNPLGQLGAAQLTTRNSLLIQLQVTRNLITRVDQLEKRIAQLEARAGVAQPVAPSETPAPPRP